jgi:hypothetical protein
MPALHCRRPAAYRLRLRARPANSRIGSSRREEEQQGADAGCQPDDCHDNYLPLRIGPIIGQPSSPARSRQRGPLRSGGDLPGDRGVQDRRPCRRGSKWLKLAKIAVDFSRVVRGEGVCCRVATVAGGGDLQRQHHRLRHKSRRIGELQVDMRRYWGRFPAARQPEAGRRYHRHCTEPGCWQPRAASMQYRPGWRLRRRGRSSADSCASLQCLWYWIGNRGRLGRVEPRFSRATRSFQSPCCSSP